MSNYDGTLKFDTKIDTTSFSSGLKSLNSIASKGMSVVQKGFNVATKAIAAAAAGLGGLGAAAIKAGASFEEGMSQVQAIAQIDTTTAEGQAALDALTAKAKEMGAQTKFSATESAEAFKYMAMAGWETEDMLAGIESVMNLAAASGEDLGTVSDIVTDSITAFGHSAHDTTEYVDEMGNAVNYATRFADVLAAAASNSNTNVGMMGETFKYAAPVAGALGYSVEDAAVAIGLMANAGIKGSQAGTALRTTMTRLAKPTKESQAAMDRLGISLTDEQGNMKSFNDVMVDMRDGFKDLTAAEKAEYAAMLGGQHAMSGLLAIVNASDEDFNKLTHAIQDSNGAAEEMAETMLDNLQGAITIMKSTAETFELTLYEHIKEPLKVITKETTKTISDLNTAFENEGWEGLAVAGGQAIAKFLTAGAQKAPEVIKVASKVVESFCDEITSNDETAAAAADLIANLAEAIFRLAGKIIPAGIELLRKLLEGLSEHSVELGRAAGTTIQNIVQALIKNLPKIVEAGIKFAKGFAEGLTGKLPGWVLEPFKKCMNELSRSVTKSNFKEAIKNIVKIIENLGKAIASIANVAGPALIRILGFIGKHLDVIGPAVLAVIAGFKTFTTVSTAINKVISVVKALHGALMGLAANPVMAIAAVVAAIAALTVGIAAAVRESSEFSKQTAELNDRQAELTSQEDELQQKIHDSMAAMEGQIEARRRAVDGVDQEISEETKLLDELKSICDENGRVKQGYEERAKVIAGELSAAFGIEIECQDGIIKKYDEVMQKIDEVIAKKKAEALIDVMQDQYTEAKRNQVDLINQKKDALDQYNEQVKLTTEAQKHFDEIEQYCIEHQERGGIVIGNLRKQYDEAKEALDNANTALEESSNNLINASDAVEQNRSTISNLDNLMTQVESGSLQDLNEAILKSTYNLGDATHSTQFELGEQLRYYKNYYADMKSVIETGQGTFSEAELKEMEDVIQILQNEFDKATGVVQSGTTAMGNTYAQTAGGSFQAGTDQIKGELSGVTASMDAVASSAQQDAQSIQGSLQGVNESVTASAQNTQLNAQTVQGELSGIANGTATASAGIQQSAQSLNGSLNTMASNTATSMSNVKTQVNESLTSAEQRMDQFSQKTAERGTNAATGFVNNTKTQMQTLSTNVQQATNETNTRLDQWNVQMGQKGTAAGQSLQTNTKLETSRIPSNVQQDTNSVISNLAQWVLQMGQKGTAAGSALRTSTLSATSTLPSEMASVGSNIVTGVWNGIVAARGSFYSNVRSFFSSLVAQVKGELGIASPSKVFGKEVGAWILPGVTDWMHKGLPDAIKAVQQDASYLVRAMRSSVDSQNFELSAKNSAATSMTRALGTSGATVINEDKSVHIENEFNVPTATPYEINRANRENVRKLIGGVQ